MCTAILITKEASSDGSVMVAHSDDGRMLDPRIIYVAAQDFTNQARRYIYSNNDFNFPRYVGKDFSPSFAIKGYKTSEPLGYISQAKHTYAYLEGSTPLMNEKQVIFGETACEAKAMFTFITPQPGERIMDFATLTRIAAERCDSAVASIKLMGELGEKYGYYGGAEAAFIADKKEGWLFEICGSPDGKSALWVAAKIPPGTIAAHANQFKIREIIPGDPNILYSTNLFAVAKQFQLWNEQEGHLDWLKMVSDGEYGYPYYSLRRVWRIYTLIDPALALTPWVENGYTNAYPLFIRAPRKIGIEEIIPIYRDHYEGTPFDLTKGLAAGPFASPRRYNTQHDSFAGVTPDCQIKGAWERAIASPYTTYAFIGQARDMPDYIGGRVWLSLDKPDTSVFLPFYIHRLPKSYEISNPQKFSRKSAWWAFTFLANLSEFRYSLYQEDIAPLQKEIEMQAIKELAILEREIFAEITDKNAQEKLLNYCTKNAKYVIAKWWKLAELLLTKYNKGLVYEKNAGYPDWWLKETGYFDGPKKYT